MAKLDSGAHQTSTHMPGFLASLGAGRIPISMAGSSHMQHMPLSSPSELAAAESFLQSNALGLGGGLGLPLSLMREHLLASIAQLSAITPAAATHADGLGRANSLGAGEIMAFHTMLEAASRGYPSLYGSHAMSLPGHHSEHMLHSRHATDPAMLLASGLLGPSMAGFPENVLAPHRAASLAGSDDGHPAPSGSSRPRDESAAVASESEKKPSEKRAKKSTDQGNYDSIAMFMGADGSVPVVSCDCLRVFAETALADSFAESRERARNLRIQTASPTYGEDPSYLMSHSLMDRFGDRPGTAAQTQLLNALMRQPRNAGRYDTSAALSMADLNSMRNALNSPSLMQNSGRGAGLKADDPRAAGWSGDEGSEGAVFTNARNKSTSRSTPSPAPASEGTKERNQKASARTSASSSKQGTPKRTSAEPARSVAAQPALVPTPTRTVLKQAEQLKPSLPSADAVSSQSAEAATAASPQPDPSVARDTADSAATISQSSAASLPETPSKRVRRPAEPNVDNGLAPNDAEHASKRSRMEVERSVDASEATQPDVPAP